MTLAGMDLTFFDDFVQYIDVTLRSSVIMVTGHEIIRSIKGQLCCAGWCR